MALAVTIAGGAVPVTTYALKTDKIEINYTRAPIQIPLAGNVPAKLLDLGQFKPQITITGTVRSETDTDGANTVPTKQTMEDTIVRAWWNNTTTLIIVLGAGTDTYVCKIANCTFSVPAAREDLWEYRMTLLAEGRT